ncbi:hypothetical protein GCM10009718_18930 [Isoptericola halotolerans]|uniref:Diketogulonate reductase-like aldo/keto reductase n=1 Tax=Isoptericola halotolerans TaxID=300560 RepID=A0ABX2A955_9MICO|nr:hypothetical protein [Isoptericola halotolerans]NOV98523.1 diketogulonate reductase-like aldo/keto reductase [Isoptericola halotolerans]
MTVPSITLNDGVQVPQVGLGVFRFPDGGTRADVEQTLDFEHRRAGTAAGSGGEGDDGAGPRASGSRGTGCP